MLSVSIGILCYNEQENILRIVERLLDLFENSELSIDPKIVIINNGSTDSTATVIDELGQKHPIVSVLHIKENKGYGFGVRTGLESLRGDVVGFMWGDNQFDAGVTLKMIEEFLDKPNVQFVKTYRVTRHDGRLRLIVSRLYQLLFRLLYGKKVRDINSGPKLFRSKFYRSLLPLESNDWFVDAEIMIKAVSKLEKGQLVELPIDFFPRKYGKSNVKFSTCFEFFKNLFSYRFSSKKRR